MSIQDTDRAIREWLTKAFEVSGKKKSDLANYLGVSPSAVTRIIKGERKIRTSEVLKSGDFFEDIAGMMQALALDRGLSDVIHGPSSVIKIVSKVVARDYAAKTNPVPPVYLNRLSIAEIDIRASLPEGAKIGGEGFYGHIYEPHIISNVWHLPGDVLPPGKTDLLHHYRCFRVGDDTMSPTINDSDVVFIDIDCKSIDSAGVYAIEDSAYNIIVRRFEVLTATENNLPRVKVSADNKIYGESIEPLNPIVVIGRVISVLKRTV